jgi:hypothetical protein
MLSIGIILFAFCQDPSDNGVCEYYKLPVHVTIRGDLVYGFLGRAPKDTRAVASYSLKATPPKTQSPFGVFESSAECNAHCRHHFFGEVIWFWYGPERLSQDRIPVAPNFGVNRRSAGLPALLEKYQRVSGGKYESYLTPHEPAAGVAIDFVPLSESSVRMFFLLVKTKKIETWETEFGPRIVKNARGREITVWKAVEDSRSPEIIDSAFAEDFYVFNRQADYYFVTQSGKLYVSPRPKKGEKARQMRALWDDPKRPVVAVIEDADNGKVWLFAKDETPGAKGGLYFEMKEKIQAESFDSAKLKPVDAPGRAKILLEYLPLIRKE